MHFLGERKKERKAEEETLIVHTRNWKELFPSRYNNIESNCFNSK